MVQLRMVHDLDYRMHRAGFGVVRAVYQAPNTRMNQRSRAHGARFNCNKQIAVSQTMVTNGSTSLAQRNDLSVSRGIGVSDVTIPSAADDTAIAHDHRAYRHFSGLERSLGAAQGLFHPKLVGRFIATTVAGTRIVRARLLQNRGRSWVFGLGMNCFLWRHRVDLRSVF